jgi:hypothetical protein
MGIEQAPGRRNSLKNRPPTPVPLTTLGGGLLVVKEQAIKEILDAQRRKTAYNHANPSLW